jgi:aldose 1-epimerase
MTADAVTIEAQNEAACFVPAIGCGCLSYRVGSVELIWGAPSADALAAKPHSSGIPILFPWPGRIDRARFSWNRRLHLMPANEAARGHAIHGLVCGRPFRLVKRGPYYFKCELDSASDPGLAAIWPYPFRLELDYEIGDGLRLKASATNAGSAPMPFGFGTHPYFRAPLGPRSTRAAMRIELNSPLRRILDDRMIPTGRNEPVSGKYDLRSGRQLDGESYDDIFSAPPLQADGAARARLVDPELKLAIEVKTDAGFRDWVVFAPTDRPAVSLEPYTCTPDAFNLAGRGIDAGARELAPGATWQGAIEIRLTAP